MATVKIGSNIASSAFKNQTTITSVKFGSRCSIVKKDAFKACTSLSEINDDNEITKLEGGVFAETAISTATFNKLKRIYIPFTTYSGVFENCSKLSYVNMPICSMIGHGAFRGCSELIEINIPKCDDILPNAFNGCINLISANISAQNIYVDANAFSNCQKLKNFNFKNCSVICTSAFKNCRELVEADLTNCYGSQIKNSRYLGISSYAFFGCSNLKTIYLSNCAGIGYKAFSNCPNLTKVFITSKKTKENYIIPLTARPFIRVNKNLKIYLETDIYDDYININSSSNTLYKK